MGDFFHGWRRKTGVVTLAMALLLSGEWMRGYSMEDNICIRLDSNTVELLTSCHYGITRTRIYETEGSQVAVRLFSTYSMNSLGKTSRPYFVEHLTGIPSYSIPAPSVPGNLLPVSTVTFSFWNVPYWSIVLPLTLISAYLLLQCKRTHNNSS